MIPKLPDDAHGTYATQSLFVLGLLVCEVLPCPISAMLAMKSISCHPQTTQIARGYVRCKFSQLVADHVLCYRDIIVLLAVVDLKLQADEIRENGSGACLRLDRDLSFTGLRSRNREAL